MRLNWVRTFAIVFIVFVVSCSNTDPLAEAPKPFFVSSPVRIEIEKLKNLHSINGRSFSSNERYLIVFHVGPSSCHTCVARTLSQIVKIKPRFPEMGLLLIIPLDDYSLLEFIEGLERRDVVNIPTFGETKAIESGLGKDTSVSLVDLETGLPLLQYLPERSPLGSWPKVVEEIRRHLLAATHDLTLDAK